MLSLAVVFTTADIDAGQVKGYYRKDGTYLRPHYRKDKSSSSSSSVSTTKAKTKSTKATAKSYEPKSYKVYQQRKTQGARTFSKRCLETKDLVF